jgi:hypothetical protein
MKTYIITIAKTFPAYHTNAGKLTNFKENILKALAYNSDVAYQSIKIHTVRKNVELWKKRFEQISKGLAKLSIREWTGKPYNSKQATIADLYHTDGIGIEIVEFWNKKNNYYATVSDNHLGVKTNDLSEIAHHDGLSTISFKEWFKMEKQLPNEQLAIIHFTGFRYVKP